MNILLEKIIDRASSWYRGSCNKTDMVISTRVRIARNLDGYSFPHWCSEKELRRIEQEILEGIKKAPVLKESTFYDVNEMGENECAILMERNLISTDFIKNRGKYLILGNEKSFSIVLNEEDHIRMQAISCGFELDKSLELVTMLDDSFEDTFRCAYHKKFGYLTSCPTNVGTGLRASVMLHLPVLVYTKKISAALKNVGRFGMVVRGFHGEGSGAFGNMYQVSNQTSLGRTEEEIIKSIKNVVNTLIETEEKSRGALLKTSRLEVEDLVFRSYAILKNCRLITSREAFEHLSKIRLGASLEILKDVSYEKINQLYFLVQSAHIKPFMKTSTDTERFALRAEIIRNNLN